MLGGAIGDALGSPVEFMPLESIRERYGRKGITDYVELPGNCGMFTDDTQMALFTAEGILSICRRFRNNFTVKQFIRMMYVSYVRWLFTQGVPDFRTNIRESLLYESRLLDIDYLFSSRAPGITCVNALLSGMIGDFSNPINNSKGCGGVMRVAPVGFLNHISDYDAFRLGCVSAAITHGHPTGYLAAGFLSLMIARLVNNYSLTDAIRQPMNILLRERNSHECIRAVDKALELAEKKDPSPENVEKLGKGWIAEEALSIAIYCCLSYPKDFKSAVLLAVNHSGDSDSTAAITGNILGALNGVQSLPLSWIERLDGADIVDNLARSLAATLISV